MKEAIEDLIKSYKGKINLLKAMIKDSKDNLAVIRYQSKKTTYYQAVRDLEMILRDEQDCT